MAVYLDKNDLKHVTCSMKLVPRKESGHQGLNTVHSLIILRPTATGTSNCQNDEAMMTNENDEERKIKGIKRLEIAETEESKHTFLVFKGITAHGDSLTSANPIHFLYF